MENYFLMNSFGCLDYFFAKCCDPNIRTTIKTKYFTVSDWFVYVAEYSDCSRDLRYRRWYFSSENEYYYI